MQGLPQTFFEIAARRAEHRAIWCDGEEITYGELAARIARLSHALAEHGVAPGDAIGVLGRNSIAFVTLMLAAADLGAVIVPVSATLPEDAISAAFEAGDVRHVFADAAALVAFAESELRTRIDGIWGALKDDTLENPFSLDALIDSAPVDARPLQRGALDAPLILSTTSGSTGAPKAIVLTQRSKLERARAAIALYSVAENDRILIATPLYHSLAERLIFTALLSGATALLMPRYSAPLWLDVTDAQSATFTIAVSSQLSQIARRLRAEPSQIARCASLRCVVSSSAPLNADDKDLILRALPGELHECYGASEIAIATSLDLTNQNAPRDSVGAAAPAVDIIILDESGAETPQGEIGEIGVKTPMMFGGYHKRPDLTASALQGGYFKTGDLGRIDENGALYFAGRKKEIIITGGINVYPSDVEAAVLQTPGVSECAAFALADAQLGELVAVAVTLSTPGALSTRALRRVCADKLADFQQPQRFFILDALPRNAMGKIMRRELPALVRAHELSAA
ncbi:MAG: class I adenylate-forming enzyme family protein [Caulobacterales bacterium]